MLRGCPDPGALQRGGGCDGLYGGGERKRKRIEQWILAGAQMLIEGCGQWPLPAGSCAGWEGSGRGGAWGETRETHKSRTNRCGTMKR